MLAVGYDAVTLGNHEFDYGPEELAAYLLRLRLSAGGHPNCRCWPPTRSFPQEHPLGETGLQNTWIRELDNGLRIGFFGLMGRHADSVAPGAEPIYLRRPA